MAKTIRNAQHKNYIAWMWYTTEQEFNDAKAIANILLTQTKPEPLVRPKKPIQYLYCDRSGQMYPATGQENIRRIAEWEAYYAERRNPERLQWDRARYKYRIVGRFATFADYKHYHCKRQHSDRFPHIYNTYYKRHDARNVIERRRRQAVKQGIHRGLELDDWDERTFTLFRRDVGWWD